MYRKSMVLQAPIFVLSVTFSLIPPIALGATTQQKIAATTTAPVTQQKSTSITRQSFTKKE